MDALKASIVGSGAVGVAAGLALIAVGAALKVFGSKFSGGGSSPVAGSSSGAQSSATPRQLPEQLENDEPRTVVNLTVQGDILDSKETPRRLAQLLNAGFKDEGLKLLQVT